MNQLIVLAFVLGIPAVLAFHYLLNARRGVAMQRFATETGLDFASEDPSLGRHPMSSLPIFQIGEGRRYSYVMRGWVGEHQVLVFDYRHRVSGLLTSLTHDSFVADVMLGVETNRDPTWHHMTAVVVSAPKVEDPSRTRVAGMPGGHTRMERAGEWLALYRLDRRVPPGQLKSFLHRAISMAEAPDFHV